MANNNLFLTGMMGSGKSTVGGLIAKKTGWKFLDTDEFIEQRAGMPVAKIFEKKGEAEFRNLEHQTIKRVSEAQHQVVALGGGALILESNQILVSKSGTLVYLSAKVETLLERLGTDLSARPLLKDENEAGIKAKVSQLLHNREAIYMLARFKVSTDGKTPEEVANEIISLMT